MPKNSLKKGGYFFFAIVIMQLFVFHNSQLFGAHNSSGKKIHEDMLEVPKQLLNIISVDMDNVPFEEALSIIAEKGQFKLNYNRNLLPVNEKITIKMSRVSALKILLNILADTGAELRINKGGHIIISPQKKKMIPRGSIYGKVDENLIKREIPGTLIQIMNTEFSTLTDEKGEYKLFNIPVGNYTLRFSIDGFKTLDKTDIIIRSNRITYVNAGLEVLVMDIQETVEVIGSNFQADEKNPVSALSISSEEVRRAPGTGGGLPRMLKVLPSVVTAVDEDTDLVIRGGHPYENGYLIDNIEVPTISHLPNLASSGGSYSALNADLIQSVNFYTSSFSSNYGSYLSAITDITLREGNRSEFDGQLNIDMAGAGFVLEGPLSKGRGSWLVNFRKSYLRLLKSIGLLDVGGVIDGIDAQIKMTYDISPAQKISLLYYHLSGSHDKGGTGIRVQDGQNYAHNTVGFNWTSYWSQKFFSNTSLAFTSKKGLSREGFATLDMTTWENDTLDIWEVNDVASTVSLRNSNYWLSNDQNKFEFGLQMKYESDKLKEVIHPIYESSKIYQIQSPIWDDEGKWSQPQRNIYTYTTTKVGLFFSYISTHFKRLTTTIGLRGDYSSASDNFHLAPRFSIRYKINQRLSLCGGAGVFYQTLPMAFLAYIPGATGLKDMKAAHYTLGMEWLLGHGTRLTIEGYIKDYDNLPISPDQGPWLAMDYAVGRFRDNFWTPVGYRVPKTLADGGSGYSRGIELLIQKKLIEKFYGFLSASYFRSRYKDLLGETHNRVYDNRFNLNLCFGYKPNKYWEFSAKWTVVGGGPYTPIDVEASSQQDRWILDYSRFLQPRYPTYNSFNIRVDKRFYFRGSSLTIFVDVWNVFNSKNVLNYWYTRWWEDFPIGTTYQMGVLPILGIKFEF